MPEVTVGHRDDPRAVRAVAEALRALHPGYSLGHALLDGEGRRIVPGAGGARILWIDRGSCETWLASGHRTNEGDGAPLPPE